MKKSKKVSIDIANLLASIISSRDIINILEKFIKKIDAKTIDLDFTDVKFVSRSAAHALSLLKEKLRTKKDISFVNTNKDVTEMLRIVAANRMVSKSQKPQFSLEKININSLLKESLT